MRIGKWSRGEHERRRYGRQGSARLLPHLDYDTIRLHPKVLMGFSDVSALLLGVHARTGLVTFHGPMGISSFGSFTVAQMMGSPYLDAGADLVLFLEDVTLPIGVEVEAGTIQLLEAAVS